MPNRRCPRVHAPRPRAPGLRRPRRSRAHWARFRPSTPTLLYRWSRRARVLACQNWRLLWRHVVAKTDCRAFGEFRSGCAKTPPKPLTWHANLGMLVLFMQNVNHKQRRGTHKTHAHYAQCNNNICFMLVMQTLRNFSLICFAALFTLSTLDDFIFWRKFKIQSRIRRHY